MNIVTASSVFGTLLYMSIDHVGVLFTCPVPQLAFEQSKTSSGDDKYTMSTAGVSIGGQTDHFIKVLLSESGVKGGEY